MMGNSNLQNKQQAPISGDNFVVVSGILRNAPESLSSATTLRIPQEFNASFGP